MILEECGTFRRDNCNDDHRDDDFNDLVLGIEFSKHGNEVTDIQRFILETYEQKF